MKTEITTQSDKARIEWCVATLRGMADTGRTGLGEHYPTTLSVLGALKRVLEPASELAHDAKVQGGNSGTKPGFVWYSQAWYAGNLNRGSVDDEVDSISIGMYAEEGGTDGEFAITWCKLGGALVPKLEVFDDGWRVLSQFPQLLVELAALDNQNVTPERMAALLLRLGFADLTERTDPDGNGRDAHNADPRATAALERLTDDGRLAVMACFCRGCGRSLVDVEHCTCMRDD